MDPITLGLIGKWLLGAIAVGAVIAIAYLSISTLRNYIREKRQEKNITAAAAMVKEKMSNGNYKVVVGFFDDGELTETQAWEAEDVDSKIKAQKDGQVIIDRDIN